LIIVDLSEIQNMALDDLAASTAFALNDAPITMLLAVLEPSVAAQVHAP
jgi:hypothetical protein